MPDTPQPSTDQRPEPASVARQPADTAPAAAAPPVAPLPAAELCWHCDPAQFDFQTTDELQGAAAFLGQARALEAVRFGIGVRRPGYNLYVLGPPGMGKRTVVRQFLGEVSAVEETPSDWCYVNNFAQPYRPRALQLPRGRGAQLRETMEHLVEDLRTAIPAALESSEHRSRLQEIEQQFRERHDRAFGELAEEAERQGIRLLHTPGGFALAPVRNGEVLSPEEFARLSPEEQNRIEAAVAALQQRLQQIMEQIPEWRKEGRDRFKQLNREAARLAIGHLLSQVKRQFADLAEVQSYLDAVEQDVVEHAGEFRRPDDEAPSLLGLALVQRPSFSRYLVNVLVDNAQADGAPVVYEEHPSYQNLIGRVEHQSEMGTLVTDFTLIKAGALHRANGGYLVVEALKILSQPYAWEGLKSALHSQHVKIESLGQALSLVSTVSLEPEPIPINLKVVLVGDRLLYYLLYQYDPDFAELFKVAADFEDQVDRSAETCRRYAQWLAALAQQEKLRPFDRAAVARLIEHSARVAGDAEKLSTHVRTLADLAREADYWAGQAEAGVVTDEHIERAIEQQVRRADRLRERVQEEIRRGTILIDTRGAKVGQVNGLSVIDLGNFAFGRPSRITATARLGKGEVVDIEREVELGGAIHSKGVLILSSFLAARFARDRPLSLSASLVFEQSYGLVEGDSASVGELCALLSALADAPIKQSLAVTGSVNQLGQVQAIGGVNEKIEGFFEVCRAGGLTGEQGVLIPAANVKHLMLKSEVRQAAAEGRFSIYPVSTVDQAISLLTGQLAGEPDEHGAFPPGSINHRVESRLRQLAELRQRYAEPPRQEAAHG